MKASPDSEAARPGPLAGIRVLEFASIGPGPFCAMMLADLGAEVLRIDRPDGSAPNPQQALLNRGRRSVMLDLKHGLGVDTVLRLIDSADVLLEGMRPGVMERLGIGQDVCLGRHSHVMTLATLPAPERCMRLAEPAARRSSRRICSAISAEAACSSPSASARRSSNGLRRVPVK